jgi:hypothetical protein
MTHDLGTARTTRLRWGLTLAAVLAVLLFGLAACGTPGSPKAGSAASPSGSGSVIAYVNCLSRHSGGGARKACKSQRPEAGLSSALQRFTSCLHSHGVTLPSASPGTGSKGTLRSILRLKSGSQTQRSAYKSCTSGIGGG